MERSSGSHSWYGWLALMAWVACAHGMGGSRSWPGCVADFQAALKDGTVLCALANAIEAGSVPKVNKSALAFKQMEK